MKCPFGTFNSHDKLDFVPLDSSNVCYITVFEHFFVVIHHVMFKVALGKGYRGFGISFTCYGDRHVRRRPDLGMGVFIVSSKTHIEGVFSLLEVEFAVLYPDNFVFEAEAVSLVLVLEVFFRPHYNLVAFLVNVSIWGAFGRLNGHDHLDAVFLHPRQFRSEVVHHPRVSVVVL